MRDSPFVDRIRAAPWLGDRLAELLHDPQSWIRRRVDRVDLEELEEVRTTISLDIWLPRSRQPGLTLDGGRALVVPVGFGSKGQKLTQFDLSADGADASLVSLEENRVLSAGVLVARLRAGVLGDAAEDLRTPLEDLCGLAAGGVHDPRISEILARIRSLGAPPLEVARSRAWLGLMAERYALYAVLERDPSQPREQRHVRLAHTKPAVIASRYIGVGGLEATVRLADIGFAGSYHLDLGVPRDITIRSAVLRGGSGRVLDEVRDDCERAALETREALALTRYDAEVVCRLTPARRAFAQQAWPTSVVLCIATVLATLPLAFDRDVPTGLVTLCLAPVAAAAALALRSQTDELTRSMVRPQQELLGIQVAVLLWPLALLACRPLLPSADWVHSHLGWIPLSVRSLAVTLLLVWPLVISLVGVRLQRRIREDAAPDG